MADITSPLGPAANNPDEYEKIADALLSDMRRLEDLMQRDRRDIEFFKAETARLEAENRVVISRLKAML